MQWFISLWQKKINLYIYIPLLKKEHAEWWALLSGSLADLQQLASRTQLKAVTAREFLAAHAGGVALCGKQLHRNDACFLVGLRSFSWTSLLPREMSLCGSAILHWRSLLPFLIWLLNKIEWILSEGCKVKTTAFLPEKLKMTMTTNAVVINCEWKAFTKAFHSLIHTGIHTHHWVDVVQKGSVNPIDLKSWLGVLHKDTKTD